MPLLLGTCSSKESAYLLSRQAASGQRAVQARPCQRIAATRGSEFSPREEEALERLRRAEAEAAELRKQIAAARVRQGLLGSAGQKTLPRLAAVGRLAPETTETWATPGASGEQGRRSRGVSRLGRGYSESLENNFWRSKTRGIWYIMSSKLFGLKQGYTSTHCHFCRH